MCSYQGPFHDYHCDECSQKWSSPGVYVEDPPCPHCREFWPGHDPLCKGDWEPINDR